MKTKLLILGLDGATFELIRPWADQGKLPNFKKVLEKGSCGILKSTIPPVTAPAWPAMYTGKNPGKLGVFYFEKEQKGTYEPYVGHPEYDEQNFWEILEDAGFKAGLVNCQMTYPPMAMKGFMVSNAPTPESEFTYPKELKQEITGMYKTKRIGFFESSREDFLKEMFDGVDKKIKTAKYLMENKDWDMFFFTIIETDNLAHFFFNYMYPEIVGEEDNRKYGDVLFRIYKKADEFLGYLIGTGNNVLVVSDHGTGFWDLAKPARVFYANKWLADEGWLTEKKSAKAVSFMSRIGLSPVNVYNALLKVKIDMRKYIPKKTQDRIIKPVASIDYPNTKAWLRINFSNFGGFRINLEGRELSGAVKKSDYDAFREELIAKLKALKDPKTNKNVIRNAWRREDIYEGPHIDGAPDIIFEMIDNYTSLRMTGARQFENVKRFSGFHTMDGIFMAYGPNMAEGKPIKEATVIDITPTVLHVFGLPIPKDMDGKVLEDIFRPSTEIADRKIEFADAGKITKNQKKHKLSKKEEEDIRKRLVDLGYV